MDRVFSEDSIWKTHVPVFSCRFGSLAIVFKTLVPGSMDRNSRDKVGIYSYTDHKIKSTTVCFEKVFLFTFGVFQLKFQLRFSVFVQRFFQNPFRFCLLSILADSKSQLNRFLLTLWRRENVFSSKIVILAILNWYFFN